MTEVWCFACYGAGYIQISNVNIVCPTCKGKGTLNKGEIQMSDEEVIPATVTPFDAIQKQIDTLKSDLNAEEVRSRSYRDQINTYREAVHNFFKDQFDGGDEEITVHRDEVNELLGDLGADLLKQEFEGHVTITYSFTVKAESVEDAEEKVKNAVGNLEYSIDADADEEYSEESIEVEF
jgi:DnaJ-class molecular chaperone